MGNIVYTDAVYTSLRNKGFDGTTTDMLYQELLGRGYSSDLNTMMFQYLGDVGYTGDLASRLSQVGGIEGYAGCRPVATFNGVSQYVSIPPVTLSGDFEIAAVLSPVSPNSNDAYLADDHGGTYYFRLESSSAIVAFVAGVQYTYSGITLPDVFEVQFVLSGSTLTCLVDGVVYGNPRTITPYTGVNNFRVGSANSAAKFFSGGIRDIKIWTGGDRNTGTLIRDYPLDDGYANNPVVRNAATGLGAELVVNGDFTDGTNNWSAQNGASIAVSDGILTLTGGATSNPLVRQNITTVIGETYLVEFTSSKTSSLTLRAFAQEEGGGYAVLSQVDKTTDDIELLKFLFTATTTSTRVNFFLNGTDEGGQFKLYNVSSKEADGYGELINGTEAMWAERCDL